MRIVVLPLLLLLATGLAAQESRRLISGLVVADESSAPVEGVTVKVKGTDKTSGTQADGVYYINVDEKDSVLVFTLDDYKTREVRINGISQADVRLEKSAGFNPGSDDNVSNMSSTAPAFISPDGMLMTSSAETASDPAGDKRQGKPVVIEGVVYHDKNKNPVNKAYVFITEGEEEYLTDSNGYFRIETWQKLPLNLTVKHDGKPASRYKVTDAGARQVILLR